MISTYVIYGVLVALFALAVYASMRSDSGNVPFLVLLFVPAMWVTLVLAAHMTGVCRGATGSGVHCGQLDFLEPMSEWLQVGMWFLVTPIFFIMTLVFWMLIAQTLLTNVFKRGDKPK